MGPRRHLLPRLAVAFGLAMAAAAPLGAQSHHRAAPAADPNAAAQRPTHTPKLALHPLLAWQHVRAANEAFVAAQRRRTTKPELPPRPAGAGRYVCAVLACADADVELAPRLGLARDDVLVLRTPGPLADAEATALLSRLVEHDRLSLVLVLGHDACRSLAAPSGAPDALEARIAPLRRDAERRGEPLTQFLVRRQREMLLAASDTLRAAVDADRLRVMTGVLDDETGAIRWCHQRIDELPLMPVK